MNVGYFFILPTDIFMWLMALAWIILAFYISNNATLKASWNRVWQHPIAAVAAAILLCYFAIALSDSIHFSSSQASTERHTVLDFIVAPAGQNDEKTYSKPFASHLLAMETVVLANGEQQRIYPKLLHVQALPGSHLMFFSLLILKALSSWILFSLIYLALTSRCRFSRLSLHMLWRNKGDRWFLATWLVLFSCMTLAHALTPYYHLMGTDKVGQDVFYQAVKSVRTGFIIGTLTSFLMLPFAILLGIAAGFLGGFVDDVVQYLYTTISSIPAVLLIAASVLSLQIFIENHPSVFHSMALRADLQLFALCVLLGLTSWTGLCRLLRAETLKLRELDFVQAAKTLGVSTFRIFIRHIFPNLFHLILITTALDFSGLVLAEAVLSYVGVGVDPSLFSWGNMINSARMELARDPVVWWPLAAAFTLMFILVLAANLFADVLQKAFDPKQG